MQPDDRWRIAHMVEAAEQALSFVHGRQKADLASDTMLRLALPPLLVQLRGSAGEH